jgi:hypothetical protein
MVEIRLAERKRFLDAETGSPEHGDEAARPPGMDSITGGAHDRHDLLDVRWVRRIADALLRGGRPACVVRLRFTAQSRRKDMGGRPRQHREG